MCHRHYRSGRRHGQRLLLELLMVQASQKRATQQLADFLTLSSAMKSQHISATQADVTLP
ncbi:hypothetical protein [Vreelandella titanicae]|uniref:hypothetical protein n=1 Tax=Vreelandella titanicae TaxID=664683 RepID=UPI003803786E